MTAEMHLTPSKNHAISLWKTANTPTKTPLPPQKKMTQKREGPETV
jgi:hypothetical protein